MAPAMTTGGVEGPRVTPEASLTPSSGSSPPPGLPRWLFVAFALLLLALLAGGAFFYEIERRRLRATAESELEVVGRLKVHEIAAWRVDCLGDASVLMENRFLGEGIAVYLSSPQPKAEEGILSLFRSLQRYDGYDDVLLADAKGHVRWSLSGTSARLHEAAEADLSLALATRRPVLGDLHAGPGSLPPHLDVIAPVFAGDPARREPVGAIVLQSRAHRFLFPLITTWPTSSRSAETLLVRRDGDSVLYLNELRHRKGTALELRLPLSSTDVPSVMAVRGRRGVVEGTDYRGVPVLAALTAVPDSPWIVVAKVDVAEALAASRSRSLLIAGLLAALAIATLVAFFAFRQHASKSHYQRLYEAESGRAESEARFSTVFHASPQAVTLARFKDDTIVDVNQAWTALTGWSREEIIGRTTLELNLWAHPAEQDRLLRMLREQGTVRGFELQLRTKPGAISDLLMSAARLEVAGEPYLLTMAVDISDRKRAEEALRDSEERFRGVFQGVTDGILLAEIESGAFVMANPAICEMLGYSEQEILGLGVKDIHPAEHVAAVSEVFHRQVTGDQILAPGLVVQRKDGSTFIADISSVPILLGDRHCLIGVFRDMTAFNELERHMRQAQKMEAVGQLAGGVAHDFNNILAVILGYSESVQRHLATSDPQHGKIEEIRRAAERGASLTHQLLAFSRKQVLQPRVLELNALVQDIEPMLRRLIGEHVELVTALGDGLGQVMADEVQIQQLLMNLAVNARDAMPNGGTLTIETAHKRLDAGPAGPDPETSPGDYVVLTVRDTGHGMDALTLSHIFEPFFTTKEHGRGTGLGLATVYGVVKESGGHIEVESEPNQGATFRVCLPMIEGRVEPPPPELRVGSLAGGSETILLLEDDTALRSLEEEILVEAGYRVIVAAGPEEALATVGALPDQIDLLVSDVVMPGMSGPELAAKLLERRPELKVLYISGYTADAMPRRGIRETGARLLDKPFTTEAILREVRAALDAPVPASPVSRRAPVGP
jgi:PAS domain S-box-containing protein